MAEVLRSDVETRVLSPLTRPAGWGYTLTVGGLVAIFGWSLYAWNRQIQTGLGITGLNAPVFWGVYVINFVFFIGISHAGTLISSILRITDTPWRRPFTRLAEAITVFSLPFGALSVIVDLGRPDRLLHVVRYPHFTSAILWDVVCISTYLITSCLYFYLALVPDIALCRDRLPETPAWRKKLYRTLALGWQDTPVQWKTLNRLLTGMSIFLFALVVSVHTNVSFVFGMTLKPGWHTTIISPFFVLGAIYSGVATVIVLAALFRRLYRLEDLMTEAHFRSCAKFLLALCCFWLYAMIIEHLFVFYGKETAELRILEAKFWGPYAPLFWTMVACCFGIPFVVLAVPRWRTIRNLVAIGLVINVGMWLERYTIIVPSGAYPYLPWGVGTYRPSWVEVSITAGWLAGFLALVLLFARLFPVLTVWEVREELGEARTSLAAPASMEPSAIEVPLFSNRAVGFNSQSTKD